MASATDLLLASRTAPLRKSNIRAVTEKVNAVNGINLGQGICDLPTPDAIKTRAQDAIEANKSIYSHHAGIEELRRHILDKVQTYNNLPAESPEEVMVSAGSTGGFVTAVMALVEPGDEVVLFEPFYGYHRNILQLMDASLNYVTTRPPEWSVDFEALEATMSDRTKAVVVCTPSNPSGKVWSRTELEHLLELLERYDSVAITDEIYEYMLYDGAEHVSLGSLPRAYERTVTLSGFSKTYNMTGWRLGYAVAPPPLIEKMGLLNDLLYICAPTPLQYGVTAAFDDMDGDYLNQMQSDYAAKRTLMCETLEAIGFEVPWPAGAYYVLASFEPLSGTVPGFEDDAAANDTLIREAKVATVTGRSFYQHPADGQYLLRFCYAKEMPELQQACANLREAFG